MTGASLMLSVKEPTCQCRSQGFNPGINPWIQVQSLDLENPLEKGIAIHSRILAWEIPWTEEPGKLSIVHGVSKRQTQFSN